MDQDKKTPAGAPSSDTTSALFVSARKKQLEQQETERRAKEKEDQRLAAEAEVRRLEAEVEERRRKAEEDARRVDAEAAAQKRQAEADARRIAEEARAKQTQAKENPDAVLGAPMQKHQAKANPASNETKAAAKGSFVANLLGNKKLLAIIGGGAAAAVLLIVILVATFGGGNGGIAEYTPPIETQSVSVWEISGYYYLEGDAGNDSLYFSGDGTMEIYYRLSGATETRDYHIEEDEVHVQGGLYGLTDTYIFTIISNDVLVDAFDDYYMREAGDHADSAPDGSVTFTDPKTGLQLYYPEYMIPMHILDSPDAEIVSIFSDGNMLFVVNFTDLYDELALTTNHDDATLLRIFANAFLRTYSETIFQTDNWATALGTQDFMAAIQSGLAHEFQPLSGRHYNIPAHFDVILDIDGEYLNAYMALMSFPDNDLILFNFIFWEPETDGNEPLADVMHSIRLTAMG